VILVAQMIQVVLVCRLVIQDPRKLEDPRLEIQVLVNQVVLMSSVLVVLLILAALVILVIHHYLH